jgi:hypothetical protein
MKGGFLDFFAWRRFDEAPGRLGGMKFLSRFVRDLTSENPRVGYGDC